MPNRIFLAGPLSSDVAGLGLGIGQCERVER